MNIVKTPAISEMIKFERKDLFIESVAEISNRPLVNGQVEIIDKFNVSAMAMRQAYRLLY